MIKLFVTDIDGCLLQPMQPPNWSVLEKVRLMNEQSRNKAAVPPLTICTGRPMPYAEAIAQLMGIERPIVFESAGVFFPEEYQISVDSKFDQQAERKVTELKQWMMDEIIVNQEGMIAEFSKFMDAGLIHPDTRVIQNVLPRVQEYVGQHYTDFEVHWTDVSISALLKTNNKRTGIRKLCELEKVCTDEVAYIGDSSGDIPALRSIGFPFAPSNASDSVKEVATVINKPRTEAVLTVYQQLVESNGKA